jgi:predicted naringenin-chalcone synthase
MAVRIRGLGTVVPEHSISQDDAAELAIGLCCNTAQQTKLLPALYRRTGVRTRHTVILEASTNGEPAQQSFYANARDEADAGPLTSVRMDRYETEAGHLACIAAGRAIVNSGVDVQDITHLITVSCTGFNAPGFDISLITDLPLSPHVERTHIGFMGCHGALNGLRVARACIRADPNAVVLLCAVELCSLHQQYGWNPEQIVANALFADGAAAAVLTSDAVRNSNALLNSDKVVPARSHTATLISNASYVVPDSTDLMSWRIRDNGFEMTLSAKLPKLIRWHLNDWLSSWLSVSGLTPADIAAWAVHPGGPRVLSATGEALGLPIEQLQPSRDVLAAYGNMSSPTVLFILNLLTQRSLTGPCVMLGYGPGITIEAALLDL